MAHALTRVFDGIVDSITTNVTIKNSFTDSKISTIPLMIPDDESQKYFGWDLVIPINIDSFNY